MCQRRRLQLKFVRRKIVSRGDRATLKEVFACGMTVLGTDPAVPCEQLIPPGLEYRRLITLWMYGVARFFWRGRPDSLEFRKRHLDGFIKLRVTACQIILRCYLNLVIR